MLRDYPAYAGLCQNSNIDFCFVDEQEKIYNRPQDILSDES